MKLPIALAIASTIIQGTPNPHARISADEIVSTLYRHSECSAPEIHLDAAHAISIDHLEYYNFMGNNTEQAIVVAYTCMTGTAGPDVHAVYARDAAGGLVELPILDEGPKSPFNQKTPAHSLATATTL